jgi:hypothetical protein
MLDFTDPDASALEVTVAVLGSDGQRLPSLAALPPLEPWWELVVAGATRPPNLPPRARFVCVPPAASQVELGSRALEVATGDYLAVLDGNSAPNPDWLARVRLAVNRRDLAVGGSFRHDRRSIRARAIQIARHWPWRPEVPPAWMADHPMSNIAFSAPVSRSLGGFQPALIARLARFGARPVRFDPVMSVSSTGRVSYTRSASNLGVVARFRAATITRYYDFGLLHRLALISVSPLSWARAMFGIVRSAIVEGTADRTFWLSLPTTGVALVCFWIGRDVGVLFPQDAGGPALRTPDELAALTSQSAGVRPAVPRR